MKTVPCFKSALKKENIAEVEELYCSPSDTSFSNPTNAVDKNTKPKDKNNVQTAALEVSCDVIEQEVEEIDSKYFANKN